MDDAGEITVEDVEAIVAAIRSLDRRVSELEARVARVEDAASTDSGVETGATGTDEPSGFHSGVDLRCPNCGDDGGVATVQVAAMGLDEDGRLTPELLEELSTETHACVRCEVPFTP